MTARAQRPLMVVCLGTRDDLSEAEDTLEVDPQVDQTGRSDRYLRLCTHLEAIHPEVVPER